MAARDSQPGDFTHQIFAARTLGLTQRLPQHLLKSYLSGLLIGHELVSGLAKSSTTLQAQGPLLLIGEVSLCQRYAKAFAALGVTVTQLTPAEREEFVKATRPVYTKWKGQIGADLVNMAEKAIAARKQ